MLVAGALIYYPFLLDEFTLTPEAPYPEKGETPAPDGRDNTLKPKMTSGPKGPPFNVSSSQSQKLASVPVSILWLSRKVNGHSCRSLQRHFLQHNLSVCAVGF